MLATFLATTMVFVFVLANLIRQRKTGKMFEPTSRSTIVRCVFVLVAGATFANGLFHFSHGALGYGEFPAPFAKFVNSSVFSDVSNVVWGLFNLAVTTFVTLTYRKSLPTWIFATCFVIGSIVIAYLLRFVLLADYFHTHAF